MKLRIAERKQAKIKLALQGPSGSGKTYSALLLAFGLTGDWSKIAVVDTENSSADLYAHLGNYNVIDLTPPFSPERYMRAIDAVLDAGIELIILDSISHCWTYLLDQHAQFQGNSFNNWAKITPRHSAFLEKILHVDMHVIATMRTKQDYVLNQKDGKYVPEKVGLKAIQRDGVDYEFTIVFDLDLSHNSKASKDRTSLFIDKPEFKITETTGQTILSWCNEGTTIEDIKLLISECKSIEALNKLYRKYPELYQQLTKEFTTQKEKINQLQTKIQSNGTTSN